MKTTGNPTLWWIVDPKEVTGKLAFWRLRLVELDFYVLHGPAFHYRVADETFSLPETGVSSLGDEKDVDDYIPAYCVIKHESAT